MGLRLTSEGANEDDATAILGNPKVTSIQHLLLTDVISKPIKLSEERIQKGAPRTGDAGFHLCLGTSNRGNVLHDEIPRFEESDGPSECEDQAITLIIESKLSPDRESLTRWATDHDVDTRLTARLVSEGLATPANSLAKSLGRDLEKIRTQHLGPRKIEGVRRRMDRVVLDTGHDIEACLLEAEGESAGTRKEIYGDRPTPRPPLLRVAPSAHAQKIVSIGAECSELSFRTMDTRTPEQRQRIMAAVKRRDTKPELELRRALHQAGLRGWRCDFKGATGRPDLAWPSLKLAVFVDGAFWHGHESRHRPGRSGEYWDNKIEANVRRDRRVDDELRSSGWISLRVWDFEVAREVDSVVTRIRLALREQIAKTGPSSAWQRDLVRRRN
jgi:DNA mismatch endonuclease (patch repair protein)